MASNVLRRLLLCDVDIQRLQAIIIHNMHEMCTKNTVIPSFERIHTGV